MPPSLRDHAPLLRRRIAQWTSMRKCSRCLLPEAFRDIRFDEGGRCNHCTHYLELAQRVEGGAREQELAELVDRFRAGPGARYDAIVCYSGGKDSSYLLHRCVEVHGLRVLAVTMRTGFESATAARNVATGIELLGVDHRWLDPDPRLIDAYRFGFLTNSGMGLECDVCDLCDGHTRRRVVELAIELDVPMIVHGADHFQLIDLGLDAGSSLLHHRDACWPAVARARGVLAELFEIRGFDRMKRPPLELYPFLFLPYDEELIIETAEELGLVTDADPDATNCDLVFLINALELLRSGYPAYIHCSAAAILQGQASRDQVEAEVVEWLEEYLDGTYDERVLAPLERLGLTLEQLIDPGPVSPCPAGPVRGVPSPPDAER
jgi:tRNA(Ile)-lysidine synthase TilS/MesJ